MVIKPDVRGQQLAENVFRGPLHQSSLISKKLKSDEDVGGRKSNYSPMVEKTRGSAKRSPRFALVSCRCWLVGVFEQLKAVTTT